jgi:hypothetical protein
VQLRAAENQGSKQIPSHGSSLGPAEQMGYSMYSRVRRGTLEACKICTDKLASKGAWFIPSRSSRHLVCRLCIESVLQLSLVVKEVDDAVWTQGRIAKSVVCWLQPPGAHAHTNTRTTSPSSRYYFSHSCRATQLPLRITLRNIRRYNVPAPATASFLLFGDQAIAVICRQTRKPC